MGRNNSSLNSYSKGKTAFYSILTLLVLAQLFFTYKGIENTPFFHFGMFSEPSKKQHKIYYIQIDGKELALDKKQAFNKEVFLYNIENYESSLQGDTQVRQVLQQRINRLSLDHASNYAEDMLSNNKEKNIYQQWLLHYVLNNFPNARSIEIGFHILNESNHIIQSTILMHDERN